MTTPESPTIETPPAGYAQAPHGFVPAGKALAEAVAFSRPEGVPRRPRAADATAVASGNLPSMTDHGSWGTYSDDDAPIRVAAMTADEARFVALQETDERQAAELAELRAWCARLSHTAGADPPRGYLTPEQDVAQIRDMLAGYNARLMALEAAAPVQHVTWADLVERWTSRKWLAAFIPGLITIITTIGYALGDVDPRIPAVAAAVTTVLAAVFQVVEGQTDKAVRVAEVHERLPSP